MRSETSSTEEKEVEDLALIGRMRKGGKKASPRKGGKKASPRKGKKDESCCLN